MLRQHVNSLFPPLGRHLPAIRVGIAESFALPYQSLILLTARERAPNYLALAPKACYTSATMSGGEPARKPVSELVAQSLARWGLTAPAVVFLELHRPVAFAAGQFAIFFQSLLGFVVGDQDALRFSHWLEDEENIARLIRRLTGEDVV